MRVASRMLGAITVVLCTTTMLNAGPPAEPQTSPEVEKPKPAAPLVVQAPGDVEISIQIKPTAKTQELRLSADSGSFYRSSSVGLNGVDSQEVHTFMWRGFPVGEYDVIGMLVDSDGTSEVVVRGALKVIDPFRRP